MYTYNMYRSTPELFRRTLFTISMNETGITIKEVMNTDIKVFITGEWGDARETSTAAEH